MNVFEDLIDELKEENLLELTVIDGDEQVKTDTAASENAVLLERNSDAPAIVAPDDYVEIVDSEHLAEAKDTELELAAIDSVGEASNEVTKPAKKQSHKQPKLRHGKEYFKKRAVDEVSSHQMVEHIFTGVEREYMKVVPKTFDDFNAKKALNAFLNIEESSHSQEHKAAEFALMQETEAWSLALLERDKNIPVSNIRHYCENSRPALSSQAMLALARFYRNAPYSETVRAKFDFVITRLFSRPTELDRRICLFSRDEILGHVQTLYSDWSSIPIYTADSDDSNVMLTGLSFDDLATEAENAATFDQLIESDFFGRLRLFKESISELFYEPSITAAAIESNIRIGNAYVTLIVRERQKMDAASIQSKYSEFSEQSQSVSDAAGRSLDLGNLLNGLTDEAITAAEAQEAESDQVIESEHIFAVPKPESVSEKAPLPIVESAIQSVRNVNRWILIVGLIGIFISGGLYVWSSSVEEAQVSTAGVSTLDLEGVLADHLTDAKISEESLSAVLLPSWDGLPKEKREEYLQKVYQLGVAKGYKKVSLLNRNGKPAAYASATRLEVYMP